MSTSKDDDECITQDNKTFEGFTGIPFEESQETTLLFTESSIISQSDIETSMYQLLNFGILPPYSHLVPVSNLIQKQKAQAILDRNYDAAEMYENAISTIQSTLKKSEQDRDQVNECAVSQEKACEIQNIYEERKKKWDEKIQKRKDRNSQALNELSVKQQEELDHFKASWSDPEFLNKHYNKPSNALLELRQIEARMGRSRCYDDAVRFKAQADVLQKREERRMQEKMKADMQIEYQKLKKRQADERKAMLERQRACLESLHAQQKQALQGCQNRLKNRALPPHIQRSIPMSAIASTIPTPRTKTKIRRHRSEQSTNLRIKPPSLQLLHGLGANSRTPIL